MHKYDLYNKQLKMYLDMYTNTHTYPTRRVVVAFILDVGTNTQSVR